MAGVVVRELRDGLERFDRDFLLTCATTVEGTPVKELKELLLLVKDCDETLTNGLDLLSSFLAPNLDDRFHELVNVALGHFPVFTIGAERDDLTT